MHSGHDEGSFRSMLECWNGAQTQDTMWAVCETCCVLECWNARVLEWGPHSGHDVAPRGSHSSLRTMFRTADSRVTCQRPGPKHRAKVGKLLPDA